MTRLNIRALAAAAGIANPLVFSKQSGLAYAMCYKLWNDQQTRIDLGTIDRLCGVLRCTPGDLFVRETSATERPDTPAGEAATSHAIRSSAPPVTNCRRIRWID